MAGKLELYTNVWIPKTFVRILVPAQTVMHQATFTSSKMPRGKSVYGRGLRLTCSITDSLGK